MKKFKLQFTENELKLLDGMCRHCLRHKDRFLFNSQNPEITMESLAILEDFILKINNAIEV